MICNMINLLYPPGHSRQPGKKGRPSTAVEAFLQAVSICCRHPRQNISPFGRPYPVHFWKSGRPLRVLVYPFDVPWTSLGQQNVLPKQWLDTTITLPKRRSLCGPNTSIERLCRLDGVEPYFGIICIYLYKLILNVNRFIEDVDTMLHSLYFFRLRYTFKRQLFRTLHHITLEQSDLWVDASWTETWCWFSNKSS